MGRTFRRRAYASAGLLVGAWAVVIYARPTIPATVLALLLTGAAVLVAPG